MRILLLPGLYNSDHEHWQSHWERDLPNAQRVLQQDWTNPTRQDWVATLDAAIAASGEPVILVAHSLGCALVAWWAATSAATAEQKARVRGALLVAPPDVTRAQFPAPSFSPMPINCLPFTTIVVASEDDPWCELSLAQQWALEWGAQFHCIGALGHINSESALGEWQQGQQWLLQLFSRPVSE
jgi:predicted alpha/beta hydrolase family esterase